MALLPHRGSAYLRDAEAPPPGTSPGGALRSVVLADFRFMFGNVLGLDLEGRVMDGDLEVSCDAVFDLLEHCLLYTSDAADE